MELIVYYCTTKKAPVENVSVEDGKLISIEKYLDKDVNFKINDLTDEEKKNIELLITELAKYKLNEVDKSYIKSHIKHIISLYFYTCKFNINNYIADAMDGAIDYFLWFFNKELPKNTNQNTNQKFVDLMNNINKKIDNLKDKKFFKVDDRLEFNEFFNKFFSKFFSKSFSKFFDKYSNDVNSELCLKLKNLHSKDVKDVKDVKPNTGLCIFFNIKDLDIKKINSDKYDILCSHACLNQEFTSISNEKEMREYIKDNFMIKDSSPIKEGTSEAASSSNKKKISIGILLFIIVLIGIYLAPLLKIVSLLKKEPQRPLLLQR